MVMVLGCPGWYRNLIAMFIPWRFKHLPATDSQRLHNEIQTACINKCLKGKMIYTVMLWWAFWIVNMCLHPVAPYERCFELSWMEGKSAPMIFSAVLVDRCSLFLSSFPPVVELLAVQVWALVLLYVVCIFSLCAHGFWLHTTVNSHFLDLVFLSCSCSRVALSDRLTTPVSMLLSPG